MSANSVALASDHAAFELKNQLIERLQAWGYTTTDLGTNSTQSVDYPLYAGRLTRYILQHKASKGILLCGTGIGMSICANRFPGIRAALCTSAYMAAMARAHNDANVLCLGSRVIGEGEAENILDTFLKTKFLAGRHARRLEGIDMILEQSQS